MYNGAISRPIFFVDLYRKNLELLLNLNNNLTSSSFDLELAKKKSKLSSFQKDFDNWKKDSNIKAISLPRYMPGNDFTANVFRETSLPYKSVESIDDYIDYHDDPHVKALGSDFYFYLKENNVDPCDTSSLDTPPIPGIVCLGVGNGEFLNYMVKAYALLPYNYFNLLGRSDL